jgi:hypothetical protein
MQAKRIAWSRLKQLARAFWGAKPNERFERTAARGRDNHAARGGSVRLAARARTGFRGAGRICVDARGVLDGGATADIERSAGRGFVYRDATRFEQFVRAIRG